jgi:MFS transporter, DHA1 family, tetracycline resistance protein
MSTHPTTASRVLPIVFATLFLDMTSIGILFPIIASIFTDPTSPGFLLAGYPQQYWVLIAGIVTAVFGVMQFFAAPLLGELSDVYGRKRLLTLGVGVLAVSQILFGIGLTTLSLALVFIARAVGGFAAANFSIAQAAIADITEPKDRAKNFGLIGAAFGLGFIVGPLLGGYLAHLGGPAMPFWFAGFLGLVNMLSVYTFMPETKKVSTTEVKKFTLTKGLYNIRAAMHDTTVRHLYAANFLYMLGFSFFTTFSGIYLVARFGLSPADVGAYFGVIGVWIVITQGLLVRLLAPRATERDVLRVTLLALPCALLAFPYMPTYFAQMLFVFCIAIPQGLTMANISALVSKSVPADKQGAALGINSSLIALSAGIAPLIGGVANSVYGLTATFYLAAVSIFIAWSALFIFTNKLK